MKLKLPERQDHLRFTIGIVRKGGGMTADLEPEAANGDNSRQIATSSLPSFLPGFELQFFQMISSGDDVVAHKRSSPRQMTVAQDSVAMIQRRWTKLSSQTAYKRTSASKFGMSVQQSWCRVVLRLILVSFDLAFSSDLTCFAALTLFKL